MQTTTLRSAIIGFSSLFLASLLFSCTKNATDVTALTNETVASTDRSPSSSNENTIHSVPFESNVYVPCANGGTGEYVALSGFTNFIYQIQWNNNGFTMVYHDNVHQLTGVGVSSGETFVASGGTNGTVMGSWVSDQWVGTTTSKVKVVGPTTNFTVTYKDRITIKRDGTVAVEIVEITVACN
jgi:hypothetical protein